MLDNFSETISNYSAVKGQIPSIRTSLDEFEERMDKDIANSQRSAEILRMLPDDFLRNPSQPIASGLNSVFYISENALEHSKQSVRSFQAISSDIASLTGSTAETTSLMSNSGLLTSLQLSETASRDYSWIRPKLRSINFPTPLEKKDEVATKLMEVKPNLKTEFDGTWQTFRDGSEKDRHKQAAHSMREILSDFLQVLAPDDRVRNASWFEPDETARNGITQKHRVKYAILGKREERFLHEKDLNAIAAMMDGFRKAYEDPSGIAHYREEEVNEDELSSLLESYIGTGQDIILTISRLRQQFFLSE